MKRTTMLGLGYLFGVLALVWTALGDVQPRRPRGSRYCRHCWDYTQCWRKEPDGG